MNMQKLLNVLIALFLAINAILYAINHYRYIETYTISQARVDLLDEVLAENGFQRYDYLPKYYPMAGLIVTAPEDENEDALVAEIFYDENRTLSKSVEGSEAYVYQSDNEKLTFDIGNEVGRIYYAALSPTFVPETYDTGGYIKAANTFTNTITMNLGDFELTDDRAGEGYTLYFYNERFEDQLIFSNEVVIKMVDQLGVAEARAIRYVPVGFEDTKQDIYPPDEVLYGLMSEIRKTDDGFISITDIDLGYRLREDVKKDFVSVVLEPYYRIKTGSGQTYYINAYTNVIVKG